MLYLEDEGCATWPAIARVLSLPAPLDMVLYFYLGQGAGDQSSAFPRALDDEPLEPITTYDDDTAAPRSVRVAVDERLLDYLASHVDEFEEWGDSLALYRPGRSEIVGAAIPHESMILVVDEFGSVLEAAGFRFANQPPEWW